MEPGLFAMDFYTCPNCFGTKDIRPLELTCTRSAPWSLLPLGETCPTAR